MVDFRCRIDRGFTTQMLMSAIVEDPTEMTVSKSESADYLLLNLQPLTRKTNAKGFVTGEVA